MRSKNSRFNSIRVKWTIVLLLLCIVPLLGSTLFLTQYLGDVIRDDNEQIAGQTLQMNVDRIEEWVQQKAGAVAGLVATHKELAALKPETLFPVLQILDDSDSQSEGYSLIDKNGQLLNMMKMTADMSKADYFLKAKETNAFSISSMSYLEPLKKYIIPIIVPVQDDSGKFAGGIAFSLTPDVLGEMAKTIKLQDTGYGYLVSADGTYYTSSDPERIGKNMKDFASTPEMTKAFDKMLANDSGSVTYRENGRNIVNYYQTVPNTGWKLVISVPESEITATVDQAMLFSMIIVGVVVVLVAAVSVFLTRMVSKPLIAVSHTMNLAAAGDLTQRIQTRSRDEIGQMSHDINTMLGSFADIIQKIERTVSRVSDASAELLGAAGESAQASGAIAAAITGVAAGAKVQAQGAEQSSRATEEMAVGVQRISESAANVSDQSEGAASEVENGNREIESAIEQMNVIASAANVTAERVTELAGRSDEIGEIVALISDMANQTSLLSLNASIEAARAGEHGRGFSVVASEVKKLAAHTDELANNIKEIIGFIQESTASTSDSMQNSIAEIGKGISRMESVGMSFQQLRTLIREVSTQMQDVSATTQQLSAGAEEITASVEEMFTVAKESSSHAESVSASAHQQNALMDEISLSTRQLNEMMLELKQTIDVFKV